MKDDDARCKSPQPALPFGRDGRLIAKVRMHMPVFLACTVCLAQAWRSRPLNALTSSWSGLSVNVWTAPKCKTSAHTSSTPCGRHIDNLNDNGNGTTHVNGPHYKRGAKPPRMHLSFVQRKRENPRKQRKRQPIQLATLDAHTNRPRSQPDTPWERGRPRWHHSRYRTNTVTWARGSTIWSRQGAGPTCTLSLDRLPTFW